MFSDASGDSHKYMGIITNKRHFRNHGKMYIPMHCKTQNIKKMSIKLHWHGPWEISLCVPVICRTSHTHIRIHNTIIYRIFYCCHLDCKGWFNILVLHMAYCRRLSLLRIRFHKKHNLLAQICITNYTNKSEIIKVETKNEEQV